MGNKGRSLAEKFLKNLDEKSFQAIELRFHGNSYSFFSGDGTSGQLDHLRTFIACQKIVQICFLFSLYHRDEHLKKIPPKTPSVEVGI